MLWNFPARVYLAFIVFSWCCCDFTTGGVHREDENYQRQTVVDYTGGVAVATCKDLKDLVEITWKKKSGHLQQHHTALVQDNLSCDEEITVSEDQHITISNNLGDTLRNVKIVMGNIKNVGSFITNHGLLELEGITLMSGPQNKDLRAVDNRNVLKVVDTEFHHFSSLQAGGAILSTGPMMTFFNAEFTHNKALQEGGAICSRATTMAKVEINGSNFSGNNSGYGGGCVHSENTGGALVSIGALCPDLNVSSSDFTSNDGGALRVVRHGSKIDDCTFRLNSGQNDGTALHIDVFGLWTGSIVISRCTFEDNEVSRKPIFFTGAASGAGMLVGSLHNSVCKAPSILPNQCYVVAEGGGVEVDTTGMLEPRKCNLCQVEEGDPKGILTQVRQLQVESGRHTYEYRHNGDNYSKSYSSSSELPSSLEPHSNSNSNDFTPASWAEGSIGNSGNDGAPESQTGSSAQPTTKSIDWSDTSTQVAVVLLWFGLTFVILLLYILRRRRRGSMQESNKGQQQSEVDATFSELCRNNEPGRNKGERGDAESVYDGASSLASPLSSKHIEALRADSDLSVVYASDGDSTCPYVKKGDATHSAPGQQHLALSNIQDVESIDSNSHPRTGSLSPDRETKSPMY